MSTTVKLAARRFVRRANSGQVTNTQWLGAMASVADDLQTAPWTQAGTVTAVLPVNVPTTPDFSEDKYDCYKQDRKSVV